mgnify:CR=1 FL=1
MIKQNHQKLKGDVVMAKGFSRFISALLLFGMLGCVGTSVSAEETQEVQAVRRQFSTLEEVTAVQVQEEGLSLIHI